MERLATHADALSVGNRATDDVVLGPLIDAHQRDLVHSIVTSSVEAGAHLAAGGTYDGLFYRPTVLSDVPLSAPAYSKRDLRADRSRRAFDTLEEAIEMASDSEYGLSLSILTNDVAKALRLAERIPSGAVHVNHQTINDEMVNPFGG